MTVTVSLLKGEQPARPPVLAPSTGPGRRRPRAARLLGRVTVHIVLVSLCLAWLLPVVALLVNSFRPAYAVDTSGWWRALTVGFTERNYAEVLVGGMSTAMANSLLIAVPATVATVSTGAVTAYAFARMPFRGRGVLFVALLALLVLPAQLALVPLLRLYGTVHLSGSFLGIWLVHLGLALPFATYLLRNFFAALPAEMFEAAALDGASALATFLRIALPTSLPALASLAIFDFVWIWNDLLLALVFLGGDRSVAPLTVAVSNLVSATTGQGEELLAPAAFVSMSLPLLLFFGLQRYFVGGLLAGAVK